MRIAIAPSTAPTIALGRWSLRFTRTAGPETPIDLWVDPQDDVGAEFSNAVARDNTVMLPATAQSTIAVGSYDPDRFLGLGKFHLSESSGRGVPLAQLPAGRRMKPDMAAPGESVMAANSGVTLNPPCCRCCNFRHHDASGCSVAAPHVAGVVALMFEKNKDLTFEQVRAFLQVSASRESIPDDEVPPVLPLDHGGGGIGTPGEPGFLEIHQNHFWGSGRLDALLAVQTVVVPSGAGGGGGGGNPAPTVIEGAEPATVAPPRGFQRLPEEVVHRPIFQFFAALISTHVDEVQRLIDSNKRVAVVWRRGGGPAMLRDLVERPSDDFFLLPSEIADFPVRNFLERLMMVFARFGSETLRGDVARWRDLVLSAPEVILTRSTRACGRWHREFRRPRKSLTMSSAASSSLIDHATASSSPMTSGR